MTISAAGLALTELRSRILTGSLPAGAKLHQARLARELGMSRIPVRDALRQLATEGLVLANNRTAVVAPLGIEDLSELYELRLAVEPRASALATDRVAEQDLSKMRDLLQAMSEAPDTTRWLEIHDQFHASLYRVSGRPRMVALLDQTRAQTRRYTSLRLQRDLGELNLEHRMILRAVERGEPRTVRRLLEAHLSSAWSILQDQLEDGSDEQGRTTHSTRPDRRLSSRHTRANREEVIG